MAKINKVYPSFYNGVTEQTAELSLDNQCKEMENCVPDLVQNLHKRPPVIYVRQETEFADSSKVFHTYNRGEDEEEYIFVSTGDYNTPIKAYNKAGTQMTVAIDAADEVTIKDYLHNGNLKGLTVQDRTWLLNKNVVVTADTTGQEALDADYDKTAYYWLKRASGDRYNPYNYAVYLNDVAYACNPNKPNTTVTDPATGFEDSDYAANYLQGLIDGSDGFECEVSGSLLKIWRTDGEDFTFDSWDSWGNQASEGWKGAVNKLTDLPKDFPWTGTYVEVTGDNTDNFTNYYLKWNGSSWEETRDPSLVRGVLKNMPIAMDRTDLVGGVATFTLSVLDWSEPRVGNEDNNPDPSFVDNTITDLFFYKNRFGVASTDSVVLSQTATYTNFYIKTALDVLDNDPIDVAVVSNQASKVYYVKPFNNSLYIFTQDSQFEMSHEGYLSPETVSISAATNYPMSVDVEPKVVNNSLFFISNTNNKQQLREYIKTEKLIVEGVDLNISTPSYLEEPITKIIVNGVLGMVICCTSSNVVYLYNYKDNGQERIQSAWSKWKFLDGFDATAGSFEYGLLDATMLIICKTPTQYLYHTLQLDEFKLDDKQDVGLDGNYSFTSKVVLPDYYPHLDKIGTPKDKILLKKVTVQGEGSFDAQVYRKDYKKTYTKSYSQSMRDLDLHIASKVGNVDITILDSTVNDFTISSVIIEGLFSPTSKEVR